jgi:hypothetical protein
MSTRLGLRLPPSAVACVLALGLAACERDAPVPIVPVKVDASSRVDAGVVDARVDAGATADTGVAPPDAAPAEDAAAPDDAEAPEDAAPPSDGGPGPSDGGPGLADAAPPSDGGPGPADAAPPSDGGPTDAAPPSDGGPAPADASTPAAPCAAQSATDPARYAAVLACVRDTTTAEATRRAAIDRFVREVEAGGGFPIQDGADLVFVYVRTAQWDAEDDGQAAEDFALARRAPPITIAGDLNNWVTTGPALSDEGLDFFHARIPAPPAGTTRSGYKLVARDAQGQPVYYSDPLSRRFDYDSFGRISFLRGGADHGHLERLRDVPAALLGNTRPIYVWLPPGYETSTARYPVLYMHDGNNLFDPSQPQAAPAGSWQVDEVVEAELAAGRIRAPIVVGVPNNADRFSEYTQVTDDLGSGPVGGDAADYGRFLVDDVKPRIDARFRTQADRASTGVLGSSLGGLVSYFVAATHPGVFRFVGGMSSTFAWGRLGASQRTLVEDYQAGAATLVARDQVYYLDSGGAAPGGGCTGLTGGTDNYCATVAMRDVLVTGGVTVFPLDPAASPLMPADVNIYHWHEAGAAHTESAWRARLHRPLRLFLRP